MKPEEKCAAGYLKATYPDFVFQYEPDGNVPPDFLFGNTAIEVRRLNENKVVNGKIVGLENDSNRLWDFLEDKLPGIKKADGKKYWIFADIISRPVEIGKPLLDAIKAAYLSAKGDRFKTEHGNIELEWDICQNDAIDDALSFAGMMDQDAGGWLHEVYQTNLQAIIDEKWAKCQKNKKKDYDHWWLILVDHIFPESNFSQRFDPSLNLHGFTQVLVIDQNSGLLIQFP